MPSRWEKKASVSSQSSIIEDEIVKQLKQAYIKILLMDVRQLNSEWKDAIVPNRELNKSIVNNLWSYS